MESRSPGLREKQPLSVHRHNGMVTTVRRVESLSDASLPPPSSSAGRTIGHRTEGSSATHHMMMAAADQQAPPPSRRGRKGFTVHWPFQSIATDTLSVFTSPAPELFRRATWQPPKMVDDDMDDGAASTRDSTLIPDYVVNFIRGETPETVARRKRNGGNQGMRAVDITHQHRPQRSHMGVLLDEDEGQEGGQQQGTRGMMPTPPMGYPRSFGSVSTATSTNTEMQQILPDSRTTRRKGGSGSGWKGLTTGWRSGVLLNLLLILIILIAGFVCLVVAGTTMAILVGDMNLFTGSCSEVASMTWGLYALINLAVVVLLVGANYVFQVLSSPTRSEIAVAHENRKWLEIGVPSARNFRHIGRGRAFHALVLLAVAVATQIIYNALIFTTTSGFDYDLVAVKASFLTGAQFSNDSASNSAGLSRDELLGLQELAASGKLTTNLTTAACVDAYSASFNTEYQTLLLVLGGDDPGSNSLVATARAGTTTLTSTVGNEVLVEGVAVAYCLAETHPPAARTCTADLNGILFAAVLALNLVAFVATAATLLLRRFEPLVTLGDAVASFLRDPDPSTRGNCLVARENLRTGMGGWGFTEGKYWAPTGPHYWFRSASLSQWLAAGFWWLVAAGPTAGVLVLTATGQGSSSSSSSSSQMILTPFGTPDPRATYLAPAATPAALLALAAAAPHVLLAGLYLSTNALLTAFYLTRESARYAPLPSASPASAARPLRVSGPRPAGRQTTSLYLTLPRPVSWALALWFAGMGLVLSQACFAVSIVTTNSSSSSPHHVVRGVGFSGAALLVLLAMLAALLLVVVALSLRRAPAMVMADGRAVGNPLVFEGGSCSAVLSARCHRVPGEADVWRDLVCWGVVPELGPENMVCHATYSARPVAEMDTSHRYV